MAAIKFIADVNVEKVLVDYLTDNGYNIKWIPNERENKICFYGGYKMTEKNLLKRIVIDPKIMLGKPVIKGTRLPVEIIVEKIAYGETKEGLKKDYPFLTDEDIKAALLYAAKRLAHEEVYAA